MGLRWRTQAEVVSGKGQFVCGAKHCAAAQGLASFEVHFAYEECGEHKSALVKLRVCPECARKLSHGRGGAAASNARRAPSAPPVGDELREHKRRRRTRREDAGEAVDVEAADGVPVDGAPPASAKTAGDVDQQRTEAEHWGAPLVAAAEPSREEEFDAYFEGLFA